MAHRNRWFTDFSDGDFPVRYVNVYQRVSWIIDDFNPLTWIVEVNCLMFPNNFQLSECILLRFSQNDILKKVRVKHQMAGME